MASQRVQSFAIVVDDSQAPISPYVYWIVFDLSPNTVAIGQNQLPTGARQAENSEGKASYQPPCPEGQKSDSHKYRFTVYALNTKIHMPNGESLEQGLACDRQPCNRRGSAHSEGLPVTRISASRRAGGLP